MTANAISGVHALMMSPPIPLAILRLPNEHNLHRQQRHYSRSHFQLLKRISPSLVATTIDSSSLILHPEILLRSGWGVDVMTALVPLHAEGVYLHHPKMYG